MNNIARIYCLKQNDTVLKKGTLKMVWNHTIEIVGNMSAEDFKARGYSIEPLKEAA